MDNRIKEILSEKGMTAKELAVIVGVSSVSLYNIINGKQEASANTLNTIAQSLEVPFWQLFVSPEEVQPKKDGLSFTCPHCGKDINIKVE
ncbi:helix-turn-helix transcriptional regulator [Bacteroides caccae]|uniref:helix-turn-helix transcriptional regulator n=1 Tax=Bacteroides caccae TaxID=47678 RepID=UPI00234C0785|nr:helix-turn-helix transcriptional regulator [Bacteroides caccae]MDC7127677.1 helix-turn-helix transcriptional regulator [Bacteroides caccae]